MSLAESEDVASSWDGWSRSALAIALVVLTSVGVVLVAVAFWLRAAVFDTNRFVEIIEPALESDEFAVAMGDFVAGEVVTALDVEGRLESELGRVDDYLGEGLADALDLGPAARRLLGNADLPDLANLSQPIAAAVEDQVRSITESLVMSEAVQQALPDGIARAHRAAVALLRDRVSADDALEVVDGEVQWDLLPVVAMTIQRVVDEGALAFGLNDIQVPDLDRIATSSEGANRLSEALGTRLPDGFGRLTVMSVTSLREWQAAARRLDRIVWGLLVGTLLLLAATLWVSHDRRRTVVQLAFGSALALMLGELVKEAAANSIEGAVAASVPREAVRLVIDEVLAGLRGATFALIGTAAIIGLVAHLVGRPGWMQRFGDHEGRMSAQAAASPIVVVVADHSDAVMALGFLAALAVWGVVGLTAWSMLTVAILLGIHIGWVTHVQRSTQARGDPPVRV